MQADKMQVDDSNVKRKGRGFQSADGETVMQDANAAFDTVPSIEGPVEAVKGQAARSIEGYIVVATGVHEEASEEDVADKFADYGTVKNLHLNLDRRSGFVKGYALIEYETKAEAENAINEGNGSTLLEQKIQVDFAFVKEPKAANGAQQQSGRKARGRSASPDRKDIVARID